MRSELRIRALGQSISAVLAVPYTTVMLASLLLVGRLTNGSWQAVFLGIGWSTLAGIEIGLLVVVIAGFAFAWVFVLTYNFLLNARLGRSKNLPRSAQPSKTLARSWPARSLAACLVLPLLALLALRALAMVASPASARGAAGMTMSGPGDPMQALGLGPIVNTALREAEPSFTADGRTMYFNCNNGDICVSYLSGTFEQGGWSPPERLIAPISTAYEEIEPVINDAGDKLYFTSIRPGSRLWGVPFLSPFMNVFRVANSLATAKLGRSWFGGLGLSDVYVSYRVGSAWSDPMSFNEAGGEPPINTEFEDHCLFFSADGNEAFWTSTRPGGFGGNDIWTARRVDGAWSEPENLGTNVNSPGNEHHSIPTPDGRYLYVTTSRPGGFGGDDNYITTRDMDGKWGPLANLGAQLNGPGDDRCPAWTPDLQIFLFDSVREGGFGGRDIWWVNFESIPGYSLAGTERSARTDVVSQLSNQVSGR